jgi:hypothetical protein
MSNTEIIVREPDEGGFALFRVFSPPGEDGYLRPFAVRNFRWKPRRNKSDREPTRKNSSGLWGYKTLAMAFTELGFHEEDAGSVFGLVEGFGKYAVHETGLRVQYARIRGFLRPTRPSAQKLFPEKKLRENYPDIPIIRQHEIRPMIEELKLLELSNEKPYPLMQWLVEGPEETVIWADTFNGPYGDVEATASSTLLEPAANFPHTYVHPDDQRLIKSTVRTADGGRYAFWKLLGSSQGDGSAKVFGLLRYEAQEMEVHRMKGVR